MFGLKSNKAVVGLDIGSYAVKAIELRVGTKGKRAVYDVAKIGYEMLPRDAIVEGSIVDPTAVVETIRTLFEKSKITTKDVVISTAGNVKINGFLIDAALHPRTNVPATIGTETDDVESLGKLLYATLASRWPGGPAPHHQRRGPGCR